MRKLFTVLAVLGLSTGLTAVTASADSTVVSYVVDGTFSAIPMFPSSALSNPGDVFTLTFSVPSDVLGTSPIGNQMTPGSPVTFEYTDKTTPSFSLSETCSTCLSFVMPAAGGLFSITFTGPNGNTFIFELNALGCFGSSATATTCGGFTDGTPGPPPTAPTLNIGGPFTIDDTGFSFLGEFTPGPPPDGGVAVGGDDISGTVTAAPSIAVPEPSSLLLLGSGFLALGGFARKRLIARFN
jgi:hypothetical protein